MMIFEYMLSLYWRYVEWMLVWLMVSVGKIGFVVVVLIFVIMVEWLYFEQGFCSCMGIFVLEKIYGCVWFEVVCQCVVQIKVCLVSFVCLIFQIGFDCGFFEFELDYEFLCYGNICGCNYFY